MNFTLSLVASNTPIYRIMPFKWFKVMVEEKRNTLMRPSSWDDPYEMNYSNSVIITENGDLHLDASHWFGQCWSLCEESAIMWQAFKKTQEPYVKIKIHASGLIKEIKSKNGGLRIFILSYVKYFKPNKSNYIKTLEDIISMHQWPHNFLSRGATFAELYPLYNLLTKRNVFKHEEEVRLLLFDKSSSTDVKFVSYPFDPSTIKEVVIDPWTSQSHNLFLDIMSNLRRYLPEEKTDICKSDIYSDSCKFSTQYRQVFEY